MPAPRRPRCAPRRTSLPRLTAILIRYATPRPGVEVVADGGAPHDGGQGVVDGQKAGRAHAVVADSRTPRARYEGSGRAARDNAGRIGAAAHDVDRARQLEERAGMTPGAVVVDRQERQAGGGDGIRLRGTVSGSAPRRRAPSPRRHPAHRQVDIRRRARRRPRQDTKRPGRLAGEHEPGVGDVPARPVAIGGARRTWANSAVVVTPRRSTGSPEVRPPVPAVGRGRMDDESRGRSRSCRRRTCGSRSRRRREMVERRGDRRTRTARGSGAGEERRARRVGRRRERSRGDARRGRLPVLPGRRGQWVIEEVHGPRPRYEILERSACPRRRRATRQSVPRSRT